MNCLTLFHLPSICKLPAHTHDKVSVVDRFRFWYSSRNSFQGAKSIVMQTSIVFGPHFRRREQKSPCGTPCQGLILDFLFWGKSILKKFLTHAAATKIFLGLLGRSGVMFSWKILKKISVQNWLKLHFWTLVTFTDSLISSSSIWNSF